MSLQPLIPLVALALLLSAGTMTYAAMQNMKVLAIFAAMGFTLIVVIIASIINRRAWHQGPDAATPDILFHTQRRNTRLAALVYAWAAAAFFGVYGLSDVLWRHGFQYGTVAAIIAAVLLAYVHRMGLPDHGVPPTRGMTIAHAYAVTAGLLFLAFSGKLGSLRGDWPANYIFLFGGLALTGICLFALRTYRALERPDTTQST